MAQQIFRQEALDRLSSPENLDTLIEVTGPKGWLALLATAGVLLAAIVWSVLGTLPTKVDGQGMLLKEGGVFKVVAESSGRIEALYTKPGTTIQKGEVVARVAQPALSQSIVDQKAKLEELDNTFQRLSKLAVEREQLELTSIQQQRSNLNKKSDVLLGQISWLEKQLDDQRELFEKGVIVKQKVYNTELQLSDARQQLRGARHELLEADVANVDLIRERERTRADLELQVDDARRALEASLKTLNDTSEVVTYVSGRVLDVSVDIGDVVAPGQELIRLDLLGDDVQDMVATVYFPLGQGKRIEVGMQAQIMPATVKREEHGFLYGTVTYVSEVPSNAQTMMRKLQDDNLVQLFSSQGSPIEVQISLTPDPTTFSKYKWSSLDGPQLRLDPGTLCVTSVTVEEERPIALVIPLFKKHILGVGAMAQR
ncbi:MAG: HlyD family secretion protein [Glaciecola sp.]|jgi:HlyD family secretion protein|uniref:NHLP bacteriocin system secretion protein n=1 Tax=Congregibacter sp. TaxID=2744308 RepID=UPI0039E3D904